MLIYRHAAPLTGTDADGYVTFNPGGESVRCGNRGVHGKTVVVYHADAAAVKACFLGDGVCGWVMNMGVDPEDGEPMLMECGHALHVSERGWRCDNGHEHVTAQVRQMEGWDYAADEEEATLLRKYGVDAVAMNGGSI